MQCEQALSLRERRAERGLRVRQRQKERVGLSSLARYGIDMATGVSLTSEGGCFLSVRNTSRVHYRCSRQFGVLQRHKAEMRDHSDSNSSSSHRAIRRICCCVDASICQWSRSSNSISVSIINSNYRLFAFDGSPGGKIRRWSVGERGSCRDLSSRTRREKRRV